MKIEVTGRHGILNIYGPYGPTDAEIAILCEALYREQKELIERMRRQLYAPSDLAESDKP